MQVFSTKQTLGQSHRAFITCTLAEEGDSKAACWSQGKHVSVKQKRQNCLQDVPSPQNIQKRYA